MPADETRPQAFPATRWSLVARAGQVEGDAAKVQALEDLCNSYWYPLYAFARGRGASPADAEDQTQSFFARILGTEFFAQAREERGKLRSYFLGAFTHHLANWHRHAIRERRGGGQQILSIDVAHDEGALTNEPATESPLAKHYEKCWAHDLVEASVAALETTYIERGKPAHFAALRVFLEGTDNDSSYTAAAEALGLVVNTVRQEVFRMRNKFREMMRHTVAASLDSPTEAEIDAELADLKRVLRA